MSYKTELRNTYNEDDFVQTEGGMQELTVTITLCEYRNLIRDLQRQDVIIENLETKMKNAQEYSKTLFKLLMVKSPEVINKAIDIIKELFPQVEAKAEEEQAGDD